MIDKSGFVSSNQPSELICWEKKSYKLMLRKVRKMTGALGVLACNECRFDAKKRSRDIEVEFYSNPFSRSALMASGTLALQSVA